MINPSPKTALPSAALVVVGLGMFAYGLSSLEGSGGGGGFGGSSFGGDGWPAGYSAKAQALMVFGAVLVGFGMVLRAYRGLTSAAVDLLRGIKKKVIAREWLISLGCFLAGLALVPLAFWLTQAAPEFRKSRELLTPLAQQARELVRNERFQALPPHERVEVLRAFIRKVQPEFEQLGEQEKSHITARVIEAYEPLPNLGRAYTGFFSDFTKGAWLLTLIPWAHVQLVRSVPWSITTVRRSS